MGFHFSSETVEWAAPQDFFDKFDLKFHFTVNLCATLEAEHALVDRGGGGSGREQVNLLSLKIRDPKARADVEDNFRKTIGQFLGGGAAVLIGAGFASYQTQLTLQVSRDQLKASHDQIMGDLGSDKVVVRLGGIYALEGVMNTSEQYHQPVLEALCAFVRDGTKAGTDQRPPATDIEAAITVIGRRAAGTGVVDFAGPTPT